MQEIWKDAPGFEEYYEISTTGKVKSKDRYVKHNYGGLKLLKGKLRRLVKKGKYINIDLYPTGKQVSVHRLVAEAFISNPNNYPLVMHKDNNTENNNVDNLMWGTYSMNAKQCVKDKRHKGYENGTGKRRTELDSK